MLNINFDYHEMKVLKIITSCLFLAYLKNTKSLSFVSSLYYNPVEENDGVVSSVKEKPSSREAFTLHG